jgi:ABC-type transport system substrate-binding protein
MLTKIRFKFELYSFYLKKNLPFIILGLIIGYIGVTYQVKLFSIYKKLTTPTVKIGIEGLYTTTNLPPIISHQISYGLTQMTENDKPVLSPIIKELSINQDKTNYLFKIDTSKTWHDGKKLVSSDIRYQIPGISFSSPSTDTLSITSEKPFSPMSKPLFKNG